MNDMPNFDVDTHWSSIFDMVKSSTSCVMLPNSSRTMMERAGRFLGILCQSLIFRRLRKHFNGTIYIDDKRLVVRNAAEMLKSKLA
eukprot:IDg17630t1